MIRAHATFVGVYVLVRGKQMGLPSFLCEYLAAWSVIYYFRQVLTGGRP